MHRVFLKRTIFFTFRKLIKMLTNISQMFIILARACSVQLERVSFNLFLFNIALVYIYKRCMHNLCLLFLSLNKIYKMSLFLKGGEVLFLARRKRRNKAF